jgi:steroid delta-isomerase-like uncharacterized protein
MSVAREFTEAFNRQDVDAVLACFTEDATYNDMFYGAHTGHADVRKLFERMFAEGSGYRWAINRVAEAADVELMEWTFEYTVTDAVPRSAGRRMTFTGTSVLELRDGRCHTYREYFDRGLALIRLGLSAEAVHKVLSR